MILEGLAIISVGTYVYKKINEKEIKEKKLKNEIKNKWNILMEGIGSQAENKIKQEYEMLKIIPCKYGFKAIISLPFGRTTADLRKLIPKISAVYRANVIIEPSNNSAFMRVWIKGNEIDNSELTKFKWYSYFDSDKFRNKNGETFKLSKIKDITNPMDEEDVLGTLFDVNIPSGLNYKDLKAEELDLSRKFGICEIDYDMIKKVTTCQIIDNRIDDKVEYKPIKVNPWELFIGMQHNWTPIILDNSKLANTLVSGRVGSGKTVAIITGILNLILTCAGKFELFIGAMSEKQDLALFKNYKDTKMYTTSIKETKKMLLYLKNEMKRRNKLFASKEMCFNIYRYNKLVSKEEHLKIIHVVIDECADLMESDEVQDLLFDLLRKSRNSGIYFIMGSQRFSLANINPEAKSNLSNKIMFKMSNTASAMTVADNLVNEIVALPPAREFIADYQDGVHQGKTLCLTEEHMIKYMRDRVEKNHKHLVLNNNGQEKEEKTNKEPSRFEKYKEKYKEDKDRDA